MIPVTNPADTITVLAVFGFGFGSGSGAFSAAGPSIDRISSSRLDLLRLLMFGLPSGAMDETAPGCPPRRMGRTAKVHSSLLSLLGWRASHSRSSCHKLDTVAQRQTRALIWRFYRALKAYRQHPTEQRKTALAARFDRIFTRKTGFVTLDRLLARLHANKGELLLVLERPEIPLHTNGSENDVRCQVTKRKVSGGTRSNTGRDCRDAFLGLTKTCAKLGIAFWNYLGSRLAVPNSPKIPYLPTLVRHRCASG